MKWEEFKEQYKDNKVYISVDRNTAMNLLDGSRTREFLYFMEPSKRKTHVFSTSFVALLMLATLVTTVMWYFNYFNMSGYVPVGLVVLIAVLSMATRKNAVSFIIEECLKNEEFYNLIRETESTSNLEILKVYTKQ